MTRAEFVLLARGRASDPERVGPMEGGSYTRAPSGQDDRLPPPAGWGFTLPSAERKSGGPSIPPRARSGAALIINQFFDTTTGCALKRLIDLVHSRQWRYLR